MFSSTNHHGKASIILFLILVGFVGWRPITDHDFGLNAASGREVVKTASVPKIDHLSTAGEGRPWINRLWGFQVALYSTYTHLGPSGVSLFTSLLAVGTFLLLFLSSRSGNDPAKIVIFSVALIVVQYRLRARPELVSFFFLASIIYLLERFQTSGDSSEGEGAYKGLFLIPVIQLLWVNAHGLFILGIGLQALLLGSWIVARPVGPYLPFDCHAPPAWKKWRLSLIILLSLMASFINPFGLNGVMVPFEQFRMMGQGNFLANLTELTPLLQWLPMVWSENKLFFCLIVVFFLFAVKPLLFHPREVRLYHFLTFVVFLYLALKANRNLPLFVLAASPLACVSSGEGKIIRPPIVIALLLGLLAARIVLPGPSVLFFHPLCSGFYPKEKFAFRAIGFINENNIQGPVFPTDLRDGNLLLWKGPRPVYDGRLEIFGEEFFRRYHEETITSKEGFFKELERYRVNAVLVRRPTDNRLPAIRENIPRRANDLYLNPLWSMVYIDGSFLVFVRNSPSNQQVIKRYAIDLKRRSSP